MRALMIHSRRAPALSILFVPAFAIGMAACGGDSHPDGSVNADATAPKDATTPDAEPTDLGPPDTGISTLAYALVSKTAADRALPGGTFDVTIVLQNKSDGP